MNKIYSYLALRFFQFPLKKQLMFLSIMLLVTLSAQAQVTITPQAASQTVECDGSGNTTELDFWLNAQGGAQASTSCVTEGIIWSYSPNPALSDGCGATGSVVVTFTATDACGNTETTTATFTIEDTTPPVLEFPVPTGGGLNMNLCFSNIPTGPTEEDIKALFSDDCGDVLVTKSGIPTGDNCGWAVTYTYSISDVCGNDVEENIQISYSGRDQSAPILTGIVPSDETEMNLCFSNIPAGPTEEDIKALFSDDCGEVLVVKSGTPTGDNCGWSVIYTYSIKDACGNAADDIVITYSGSDQSAPSLTGDPYAGTSGTNACLADAATAAPFSAADAIQGYTDNCGGTVTATLTSTEVTGTNCGWTVTYTFNVTDACGNALTGQTYANTGGIVEVSITGFADRIITVESGCMSQADIDVAFDEWLNTMTISGGCNPTATPSTTVAPGNCGSVEVTWTATDGCSVATATSVFTVENLNPTPVFLNVPVNTNISTGFTQAQVDDQFNNWLSTVNLEGGCNRGVTINNPGAPSACGGSAEVTWTVTSDCEAIVSGSSTFSVEPSPMLYDNIVSDDNPYAPLTDYYDGRATAYMTIGGSGSEDNPVHWSSANWALCFGEHIGDPNPRPVANANDLYIQISEGDFLRLDKLDYKNNITIVVCGYLEIGDFIVEEGGAYLNNVNIVICPGGFLKAENLRLMNNVNIHNDGTLQVGMITGQASNSQKCIKGSGNFLDLDGNTIIEHDEDGWYYNGDFVNTSTPNGNPGVSDHKWTFGDGCNSQGVDVPLPIELLSFTSEVLTDHVLLHWVTAVEINNDYFNIERSIDLNDWDVIGHIAGSGNSNHILEYQFADMTPVSGLSYYRLKQTDFDGQFEYFDPIAVNFGYSVKELEFSLTKTNESWHVTLPGHEVYNVEIFDLTGRKIYSGRDVNQVIIPAQPQAVILRVYSASGSNLSRIIM